MKCNAPLFCLNASDPFGADSDLMKHSRGIYSSKYLAKVFLKLIRDCDDSEKAVEVMLNS
jgi:hypothetical protein